MGGKPRSAESAEELDKKIVRLMRRGKFAEVLEATEGLFVKYRTAINAEDPMTGGPMRGRVGHCLNFRGVACQKLGRIDDAIESFRIAADGCIDYEARINLAETLCHERGEFDEARKLARQPLVGDRLWFRKVKLDGYASMMLGDHEQAKRCYRKVHEKYAGLQPDYLAAARAELEEQPSVPLAVEILEWLGVTDALGNERLVAARRFWSGLEPGWKKQLRALLAKESGASAREKAVRQRAEPTEDELAYMFSRTAIRINKDYDVASLEPLAELEALESVKASYWGRPLEFFAPIARLRGLKELECEGNRLPDLSFASGLTELTKLNATWNQLTTLSPLASCRKLEELRIGRNPLATIEPVAGFSELRLLWCSCRPLASLAPLESLTKLENLDIGFHSLTSLASLRGLTSLRSLSINACREGRADDESRAATRLDGLDAIARLTDLTSLELLFDPGFATRSRLQAAGDCDDSRVLDSLSKLRTLKLRHAQLQSLKPLANMTALRSLQLTGGSLVETSLAPLSQCSELAYLTLEGPRYTDLETLAALPALSGLGVGEDSISADERRRFVKARPDVRVRVIES